MKESNTILQIAGLFLLLILVAGPVARFLDGIGLNTLERGIIVFAVAMAVSYAVRKFRERQQAE